MIDQASAGVNDPAKRSAVAVRISGRLAWTHPAMGGFLPGPAWKSWMIVTAQQRVPGVTSELAKMGQFTISNAEMALGAVSGGLLGLLRRRSAPLNESRRTP